MTTHKTLDFIENVNRADIPRQIAEMLFHEASQLGFSGLAMGWLPSKTSANLPKFELVSVPEEYFKRYLEHRYDRHSAVVRHMNVTTDPFRWADVQIDDEAQPHAKKILNEAWDFGLRSGWCIPVYKGAQLSGFITASSARDVLGSPDLAQFHIMTLYAHSRILDLNSVDTRLLNVTERQIMTWLAKGKTTEEISRIFCISYRTVEWHVANAGIKLGTANRVHTIVEAIRLKQINI